MVPQALAALDGSEVPNDAVVTATHPGELRSPENIAHARIHVCMDALPADSVNLDEGRISAGGARPAAWPPEESIDHGVRGFLTTHLNPMGHGYVSIGSACPAAG